MRRRMFLSEKVISHRASVIVGKSRSLQAAPRGDSFCIFAAEQIPQERTFLLRRLDQTVPLR